MLLVKKEEMDYLRRAFSDLVNYGADDPLAPVDPVTYKTPEGDSCLHIAAARGDLRSVKLLLDAGLDVNQVGDMGNTPLHYANKNKQRDAVEFLLSRGANRDAINDFGQKAKEK
jgi:ankyrin repeat protein